MRRTTKAAPRCRPPRGGAPPSPPRPPGARAAASSAPLRPAPSLGGGMGPRWALLAALLHAAGGRVSAGSLYGAGGGGGGRPVRPPATLRYRAAFVAALVAGRECTSCRARCKANGHRSAVTLASPLSNRSPSACTELGASSTGASSPTSRLLQSSSCSLWLCRCYFLASQSND